MIVNLPCASVLASVTHTAAIILTGTEAKVLGAMEMMGLDARTKSNV